LSWAKFSDDAHRNEHILALSHGAYRLWSTAIMDNRGYEDGRSPFMSQSRAEALMRQQRVTPRAVKELESNGRWEPCEGGWNIRNFEAYLPSRREITDGFEPDPIKQAAGQKGAAQKAAHINKDEAELVAPRASAGSLLVTPRLSAGEEPAAPRARGRVVPVPVPVPVPNPVLKSNQEEHLELKHVLSAEGRRNRDEVFEAWKDSTDHPLARLDSKRSRVIDQALKAYPLQDVIDAVRGWRMSPHHRGENERATVYNDLELLLRDAKHIEQFRDLHRNGPIESTFLRLAAHAEALGR
jgi:hypothetical protein